MIIIQLFFSLILLEVEVQIVQLITLLLHQQEELPLVAKLVLLNPEPILFKIKES